jgi:hypothetical protein
MNKIDVWKAKRGFHENCKPTWLGIFESSFLRLFSLRVVVNKKFRHKTNKIFVIYNVIVGDFNRQNHNWDDVVYERIYYIFKGLL